MKKFILISIAVICLGSCTCQNNPLNDGESEKHRTVTIYVPDGYELITASRNYWGVSYLVKPMTDDYVPTTKKLMQQTEVVGARETVVVFIESRGNMTSDQDCSWDDEDNASWGLEDDVDYD